MSEYVPEGMEGEEWIDPDYRETQEPGDSKHRVESYPSRAVHTPSPATPTTKFGYQPINLTDLIGSEPAYEYNPKFPYTTELNALGQALEAVGKGQIPMENLEICLLGWLMSNGVNKHADWDSVVEKISSAIEQIKSEYETYLLNHDPSDLLQTPEVWIVHYKNKYAANIPWFGEVLAMLKYFSPLAMAMQRFVISMKNEYRPE